MANKPLRWELLARSMITGNALHREYTSSSTRAAAWTRIPALKDVDGSPVVVFEAAPTSGPTKRCIEGPIHYIGHELDKALDAVRSEKAKRMGMGA